MASNQSPPQTFTFDHPSLGPMTGLVTPDNVVQFRAIPYATLPARFKHSIPLDDLPGTNRDFIGPNFACPHTFGLDVYGGGPFPNQVAPHPTDEFGCLILQVNVPLACLQSSDQKLAKLPVMVYIHGGGFVLGKIDYQHSTAYMVEQSLQDSQPVIAVNLQYRLGALGFLHTPDGGRNFGFVDQRNAFLWVQKFIGGFGGNREDVTAFGESAGGMSICYHMLSPPPPSGPLFKRAVIMSGVISPNCSPIPISEATGMYDALVKTAGIEEHGKESLEKLRALDVQAIVSASTKLSDTGIMWGFVHDPAWFGHDETVTWDRIPEFLARCEWVDEIVLGVTGDEGTMFGAKISAFTPANFTAAMDTQLGPTNAALMLGAYGVKRDMDPNLFLHAAYRWLGDVVFDGPTHALARYLTEKTSKKVYRYVFDIRNPFPNHALYQLAHHWVDCYFVFKTFMFRYPTKRLRDLSTKHAQLWIDFANGKAPWREYKYGDREEATIMVADERDGWVERTVREDEAINERSWERVERLWESWKGAGEGGKWFQPLKIEPLESAKMV